MSFPSTTLMIGLIYSPYSRKQNEIMIETRLPISNNLQPIKSSSTSLLLSVALAIVYNRLCSSLPFCLIIGIHEKLQLIYISN